MFIYCSDLPNDQDMIHALGSCAHPQNLIVCDTLFWGYDGLVIGTERKKIGDMVSCIQNGRYLHQAQLAKEAGVSVLSLIVEGEVRENPDDGLLEIKVWGINPRTLHRAEMWQPVRPTMTYSRFDQFLTELNYLAGIIVKRSRDVHETASIIKALYTNFQTPPDGHNSLRQIYTQPPQRVPLVRPGIVQRVSKEFGGIGWTRSRTVSDRFKTVRDMVLATESDWLEVEGIGKGIAGKVVKEINGG